MDELRKQDEIERDEEVHQWLKTVGEEMYTAASALKKLVIYNPGTRGTMLIAKAFEQIIQQERAKLNFPGDAPEARS